MSRRFRLMEYATPGTMGGAEHGLLMEGDELVARGHPVVFVLPEGRRLTQLLQERGHNVLALKTFGKVDPVTLVRLIRIIRRRRIEVVHTHLSTASLLGSLAARACGVPCVATVHGLNSAFCFRFASLVVAVSEAVSCHLQRQGIPESRLRVNHNGINVHRYETPLSRAAARQQLGLDVGVPIVLFVGRLSPEKGVGLLPVVVRELQKQVPAARLLVVGEGQRGAALQEAAEALGLTDSILLCGYQGDVRPFLAAADLMLMPSYKEGLPRALLEAMAASLPVVGARVGGIPEALSDGETGLLAEPGDSRSLAAACASLLGDEARRRAMGKAARALAFSQYSIEHAVSGLEAIFQEAVGARAASGHR